ncbi:Methionine import ATP-binding protein MetN [Bifidobacterium pseudolongum subsp. globosum]|uniref:Methionine import ATP-binding protein MetN n=1 Tax=Bifidobacterium pseudolongum subsp. globosum TaxID=1690 RepID=A0A4Q5AGE8_9BIFI|nr:ATP-binding cassette domain-containing protein [Bifidobacterium pseudolongum]RYQ26623.1 Methionine import ATP-binding protein MetN [Bifidobacterium pseudolongum subsp. globosum]RYQ28615.1 Methionine import ATP-binding protein MetN [Bifidobacterium pseudolongum subsp. globosum]
MGYLSKLGRVPCHRSDGDHANDMVVLGNGLFMVMDDGYVSCVVAVSDCRLTWDRTDGHRIPRLRYARQGSALMVWWMNGQYTSHAVGVVLEGLGLCRSVIGRDDGKTRTLLTEADVCFLPGTITAIVGKSGCGKSVLMKALSGKERATSGAVTLNEQSYYRNMRLLRSHMAYLPQDDLLHDDLTVLQELRYTAELHCPRGWSSMERKIKIASIAQDLGIRECLGENIRKLSGGQRKRVAIACALLTEPRVMFLDEPTSPLDPGRSEEFVHTILTGIARSGCTVIFVTHDLDTLKADDSKVSNELGPSLIDQIIFVDEYGNAGNSGGADGKDRGVVCYSGPLVSFAENSDPGKSEKEKVKTSFKRIKASLGDEQGYERVCGERRLLGAHPAPQTMEQDLAIDRTGGLRQFRITLKRGIRQRLNTPGALLLQMAIPLIIGVIMGFVSDDGKLYADAYFTKSMMFTYSAGAFFVGIFSSITMFSKRDLLAHEQYHGLRTVPYVLAEFVIQSTICLLQSVILYAVFTAMTGMVEHDIIQRGFDVFVVIYSCAESAMVMGMLASAVFRNPALVAPLLVLVQIVFSGIVFNLDGIAAKLSYLISCKWSLDGLGAVARLNELFDRVGATTEVKEHYDASIQNLMLSLMWLWLISLFLLIVTVFVLVRRNARQYSASGTQTLAQIRGRLTAFMNNRGSTLLLLVVVAALAYMVWTGALWTMFGNAREYVSELVSNLPGAWEGFVDDFRNMLSGGAT